MQDETSRKKIDDEVEFYDHRSGSEPERTWFEKWMVSMHPVLPSAVEKIIKSLGDIRGKNICELGCGTGILTKALLENGAGIEAVDVSEGEIKVARKRNSEFIPHKVNFQIMDVCKLDFPDSSFDFVTGVSILHHVDINTIGNEIYRILKPGGKAVFTEPLAHNPISNLWRKLTPSIRTKNERPLKYSEINKIGKKFKSVKCSEFACLTLLSSLVYLFTFSKKLKNISGEYLGKKEIVLLEKFKFLKKFSGLVLIEFKKI